jgi:hypothetical protein
LRKYDRKYISDKIHDILGYEPKLKLLNIKDIFHVFVKDKNKSFSDFPVSLPLFIYSPTVTGLGTILGLKNTGRNRI